MTAASFQPAHLRYNPHETLAAFQARQRHAYQAGKAAWREGRINAQALQLYEELVRYVGANTCAWVKEETLARELGRSVSTIKRWMQQLVQAHLIHRGRRFGATSLTALTAYDPAGPTQEPDDVGDDAQRMIPAAGATAGDAIVAQDHAGDGVGQDGDGPVADGPPKVGATTTPPSAPLGAAAPPTARPALFFEPSGEPSISSLVRRDSIKTSQLSHGGGGTDTPVTPEQGVAETATTLRLQAEGIVDITVLNELHACPLAQVDAVIRYVAQCRTRDDPRRPGLIVHLLRRGFALRPHRRRPATSCAARARRHAGVDPIATPGAAAAAAGVSAHQGPGSATEPRDTTLGPLWQQADAHLAAQLDPEAFETWIAPSRLLAVEGDTAVLGTPNVFVRDMIATHYRPVVEGALRVVFGRPLVLELVIGTSLAVE